MPDEKPHVDQSENDTPSEEPAGGTDAWGKPKTGAGGAPEEEAAGWRGASDANRDDE